MLIRNMDEVISKRLKIIYVDEVNFTKRSIQKKDWSAKNSNLVVDQAQVMTGYRSVIAAVSEEKGVELIHI